MFDRGVKPSDDGNDAHETESRRKRRPRNEGKPACSRSSIHGRHFWVNWTFQPTILGPSGSFRHLHLPHASIRTEVGVRTCRATFDRDVLGRNRNARGQGNPSRVSFPSVAANVGTDEEAHPDAVRKLAFPYIQAVYPSGLPSTLPVSAVQCIHSTTCFQRHKWNSSETTFHQGRNLHGLRNRPTVPSNPMELNRAVRDGIRFEGGNRKEGRGTSTDASLVDG